MLRRVRRRARRRSPRRADGAGLGSSRAGASGGPRSARLSAGPARDRRAQAAPARPVVERQPERAPGRGSRESTAAGRGRPGSCSRAASAARPSARSSSTTARGSSRSAGGEITKKRLERELARPARLADAALDRGAIPPVPWRSSARPSRCTPRWARRRPPRSPAGSDPSTKRCRASAPVDMSARPAEPSPTRWIGLGRVARPGRFRRVVPRSRRAAERRRCAAPDPREPTRRSPTG